MFSTSAAFSTERSSPLIRGGSEWLDRKSTLVPVLPAEVGIQAVFDLELKSNPDAGVRRNDKLSLRLKHALSSTTVEGAGISTIPERDFKPAFLGGHGETGRYKRLRQCATLMREGMICGGYRKADASI
jgi:hypothetical protein